jgi:hypothetical protein
MRRFGSIARLAVLAALVAGCGIALPPDGTLFRTTVVGPDEAYPQEVVLGDRTGLVVGISPFPIDGPEGYDPPTVAVDPADSKTLIFRWGNGACDRPAITLVRLNNRLSMKVDPRPQAFGSCGAILLFRAVRIHFSQHVAPAEIELVGPR